MMLYYTSTSHYERSVSERWQVAHRRYDSRSHDWTCNRFAIKVPFLRAFLFERRHFAAPYCWTWLADETWRRRQCLANSTSHFVFSISCLLLRCLDRHPTVCTHLTAEKLVIMIAGRHRLRACEYSDCICLKSFKLFFIFIIVISSAMKRCLCKRRTTMNWC